MRPERRLILIAPLWLTACANQPRLAIDRRLVFGLIETGKLRTTEFKVADGRVASSEESKDPLQLIVADDGVTPGPAVAVAAALEVLQAEGGDLGAIAASLKQQQIELSEFRLVFTALDISKPQIRGMPFAVPAVQIFDAIVRNAAFPIEVVTDTFVAVSLKINGRRFSGGHTVRETGTPGDKVVALAFKSALSDVLRQLPVP
jgi:uncharacterized tellurite resistance protein B-like protein